MQVTKQAKTALSPANYIGAIDAELQKAEQLKASVPEEVGLFSLKTANRTIRDAYLRPDPAALWLTLWYEGELCCLFSDSNLGKSIYAVQIATHIATGQKVLYFDFELSDKQFQLRYTDEGTGVLYQFPENLYRVEINSEALCEVKDIEEAVISSIESAAIETGAKVLIIDNLTYLCNASDKGDLAGELMLRLNTLKKKYGLSMLILAHTPKRCLSNPITQNDLAGSKKLYNFFDSAFAIGKSAKDGQTRYIKQLKVRHGSYTYDSDNIIVCSIEKRSSFLQFVQTGFATEKEHLREFTEKEKGALVAEVKKQAAEGRSQREIANTLGLSVGCVNRYLNKL